VLVLSAAKVVTMSEQPEQCLCGENDVDAELVDVTRRLKELMEVVGDGQAKFVIEALMLCQLTADDIEACRLIAADRREVMRKAPFGPIPKTVGTTPSMDAIKRWVRENKLLAMRVGGEWKFPAIQLDRDTSEPYPELQLLIQQALRRGYTNWEILSWLIRPWVHPDARPDFFVAEFHHFRALGILKPWINLMRAASRVPMELLQHRDVEQFQWFVEGWLSSGASSYVDPDELLASMDDLSAKPFVNLAKNPSPFRYESSLTSVCVDRIDADGNRVTGKFEDGEFLPENSGDENTQS